jgi:KUP system potassium uptake protein
MSDSVAASAHPRTHRTTALHVPHGHAPASRRELALLSLGALGVVYGDIGTSPLYAMNECLLASKQHAVAATLPNVLGVLSLFFWSLVLVVVVKYLVFVLRADNKGEGGILALAALVAQKAPKHRTRLAVPVLFALFGAGLLYGDGVITPAISVLGALEGLSEQSHALSPFIVPLTATILIALFSVQRFGTARIGSIAGWIMLVWFVAIGIAGLPHIIGRPEVLRAISPHYAVAFLIEQQWHGFVLLGLVVLCVTGTEALYADMGHFGKAPIRVAWSFVVFPGLLLNYFGQGALFLEHGRQVTNGFYDLVPGPLLFPMMILATMAAVIASQALISGAYSLTNQAVQLGYFPRVKVVHTSSRIEGQIYIPEVNYLLMFACVTLVLTFRTSTNLAAAYGIAVTGTMAITSVLYFLVCRRNWSYPIGRALAIFIPFVIIDLTFFSSTALKITAGGWFPMAVGITVFTVMTTWWRGRNELSRLMEQASLPDAIFFADIATAGLPRVSGTAVFMSSATEGIPNVLLHHVKHNKALHEQVVLLSIVTQNVPFAIGNQSLRVTALGHGFYRVVAYVGFMQQPNVPRMLSRCEKHHLVVNPADTTYYLGRETLLTTGTAKIARWRGLLFAFLSRNARTPTAFFRLPPNRVVELGAQIEL